MASYALKALTEKHLHTVGNLNSLKVKTVANGAKLTEDVDNFMLVELGFDADGQRTAKLLTDKAKQAYLIASVERLYLGEELSEFYNGKDEFARIVIMEPLYTRFDVSAFKLNTGVTEIKNGQVAHFDIATKTYIISDAGSAHADYAGSKAKFVVVSNEDDLQYTSGQAMVRLEVQEA